MSAAAFELRGRAAAGKLESSPEARTREIPSRYQSMKGNPFSSFFLSAVREKYNKASRVGGRST